MMILGVVFALLFVSCSGQQQNDFLAPVIERWNHVDSAMAEIARNPSDVHRVAALLVDLRTREQQLVDTFNNCTATDQPCLYWARHSLRRNRREQRLAERLGRCASIVDEDAQRACAQEIFQRFEALTRPGVESARARNDERWRKAYRNLRALGDLVIESSNATQDRVTGELRRLARQSEALNLRRAACLGDSACIADTDASERVLERERHFVRVMGRCGRRPNASSRGRCVQRVLRRMRARTQPADMSEYATLPRGERVRREAEDRQLDQLHRDATNCPPESTECAQRAAQLISELTAEIQTRRANYDSFRQEQAAQRAVALERERQLQAAMDAAQPTEAPTEEPETTTTTAPTTYDVLETSSDATTDVSSTTTTSTTTSTTTARPTHAPLSQAEYDTRYAALKARLEKCSTTRCRLRLRVRVVRLIRGRISSERSALQNCDNDACKQQSSEVLYRLGRRERFYVREMISLIRARLSRCDTNYCRRRLRRSIRHEMTELRVSLEETIDLLMQRISHCGNDDCKTAVRRRITSLSNTLRNLYSRLERWVKRRVDRFRSRLQACKSDSCRERFKRRLRRIYAFIRKQLLRRIEFLRHAKDECTDDDCRNAIRTRVRALRAYLATNRAQKDALGPETSTTTTAAAAAGATSLPTSSLAQHDDELPEPTRERCTEDSLLSLRARIRLCGDNQQCKAPLEHELGGCVLLRHSCSDGGMENLRQELSSCGDDACRRHVNRRLRRCLLYNQQGAGQQASSNVILFPTGPVLGVDPASTWFQQHQQMEAEAQRCADTYCLARSARLLRRIYRLRLAEIRTLDTSQYSAVQNATLESERNDLLQRVQACSRALEVYENNVLGTTAAPVEVTQSPQLQADIERFRQEVTTLQARLARKSEELRRRRRSIKKLRRKLRGGKYTVTRNCLDGLRTTRFRRTRARLQKRLARCTDSQCRTRYRSRLLAIYRRRMQRLRRRSRQCTSRRLRRVLQRGIRHVRQWLWYVRNQERREQLVALRQSLVRCGSNTVCIQAVNTQIQTIQRELDLSQRLQLQLKLDLSRCGAGIAGRPCRRRVFDRYRRQLHARQLALLREEQLVARARYSRAVLACSHNLLGNTQAVRECVLKARGTFSERLVQLRVRELRADLRMAMRQCDYTAVPSSCVTNAIAEFNKDKVVVTADADQQAQALLNQMAPQFA